MNQLLVIFHKKFWWLKKNWWSRWIGHSSPPLHSSVRLFISLSCRKMPYSVWSSSPILFLSCYHFISNSSLVLWTFCQSPLFLRLSRTPENVGESILFICFPLKLFLSLPFPFAREGYGKVPTVLHQTKCPSHCSTYLTLPSCITCSAVFFYTTPCSTGNNCSAWLWEVILV